MKKNILITMLLILCTCTNFLSAQEISAREIKRLMKCSTLLYCKIDTVVSLSNTYVKYMEIRFKDTSRYKSIYLQSNFFKPGTIIKCEYITFDYANNFIRQYQVIEPIPKEKNFLKKFNRLVRTMYLKD